MFVHTLMEVSLRDDIISAYLGALITAVSDIGDPPWLGLAPQEILSLPCS